MLATSSINGIEAADLSTIGVQRPRGRGGSRLSKQFGQRIREQSLGRGRDSRPREEAQRRKMNNRKGWVVILNQFIDALKCFCRSFLYSCQSIACLEGSVVHSPCKRRPRLLMASEAICSEAKEIARMKAKYFTFWSHLFSSQVLDACEIARRFARRWLLGSLSPSSTSSSAGDIACHCGRP